MRTVEQPIVVGPSRMPVRWLHPGVLLAAGMLGTLWAHWPVVYRWYRDLCGDSNYSAGLLVPLATGYAIWLERARLRGVSWTGSWAGLFLLGIAQLVRLAGMIRMQESIERYGVVLTLVAMVWAVTGGKVFRQIQWIMLFLFLAVPFPGTIHNAISSPLQRLATDGAMTVIELAGVPVTQNGNVITVNQTTEVAVAEACSGLRMLTAFIVVAAFLALTVNRPAWQKWTLVISSIPVAIFCNLVRLVVTVALFVRVSSELAEKFFHDFAGWTMMPLAIVLLVVEIKILSKLVIEEPREQAPAAL